MKIKLTLVTALAIFSLVAIGCGGDDSSSDTKDDEEQITALITEINRVAKEKDAQGFCAVMQPSGVKDQFATQARCVEQTSEIFKQDNSTQPVLEIEDIEVDGDQATVDLKSEAGGAPVTVVKEGGKWYVPFASESDVATGTTDE